MIGDNTIICNCVGIVAKFELALKGCQHNLNCDRKGLEMKGKSVKIEPDTYCLHFTYWEPLRSEAVKHLMVQQLLLNGIFKVHERIREEVLLE